MYKLLLHLKLTKHSNVVVQNFRFSSIQKDIMDMSINTFQRLCLPIGIISCFPLKKKVYFIRMYVLYSVNFKAG